MLRSGQIATDIGLVMFGAMRRLMREQQAEFDPRKAFAAARLAAKQLLCLQRFEAFDCAGHAARLRPLPLEAMLPR
ncbi:hypothetical protein [Roseateles sp.]|uniref:hypothetical protein n=1 Tax=Roseateles sp. TaxID=1971397 RepID=UPI00286CEE98|nr:hypothetical protein [Roseateles sp.]